MRIIHWIVLIGGFWGAQVAQALPPDSIYQVQSHWIDQDGKGLVLADLKGRPVALSMVYLSCTYTCPTTVTHLQSLEKLLSEKAKKEIQFILVSFDPKRDTPELMKTFAKKHALSQNFRMITSKSESSLRELSNLIDFKYKKTADGEFEHSFGIVALDRSGRKVGSTVGTAMKVADLVPLIEK